MTTNWTKEDLEQYAIAIKIRQDLINSYYMEDDKAIEDEDGQCEYVSNPNQIEEELQTVEEFINNRFFDGKLEPYGDSEE